VPLIQEGIDQLIMREGKLSAKKRSVVLTYRIGRGPAIQPLCPLIPVGDCAFKSVTKIASLARSSRAARFRSSTSSLVFSLVSKANPPRMRLSFPFKIGPVQDC
jgi:hypothetical protein